MSESLKQKYARQNRKRCRLRDLGIKVGRHLTGPHNAITDVKGVKVGHFTLMSGTGAKSPGRGPVRTGVTVVLPTERIFDKKLIANGFILNGAGEVSGLTQLVEWGILETPIALTNTMAVGRVSDGLVKWMSNKYESIWDDRQVVIPVVGECDDSFLNDSVGRHTKSDHVIEAIKAAKAGPVPEGSIGSGTGMICCDFKGGIGTSSRIVMINRKKFTIGVLVMTNFGVMEELRVNGIPLGEKFAQKQGAYRRRVENYGSIIAVIATDLPLGTNQIGRLCKRAALGIGRVGSHAAHGSGEIIVGFSTANVIKHSPSKAEYDLHVIHDQYLDTSYQSVIEATEEAILNALTASGDMEGVDGHWVPGIDLELLRKYYDSYWKSLN